MPVYVAQLAGLLHQRGIVAAGQPADVVNLGNARCEELLL
jgi:hypothetical protein